MRLQLILLGALIANACALTGCGGAHNTLPQETVTDAKPMHGASPNRSKGNRYQLLHSFQGAPDGALPVASLTSVKGLLYGVTSQGGTKADGTVFEITADGTEKVIYDFLGKPDGASPQAGLLNVNGELYGTTAEGGIEHNSSGCLGAQCGTIFKVNTSGKEQVLYEFQTGSSSQTDGANPMGPLIYVGGNLYGTTTYGGRYGYGSVFEIALSGHEEVLHSFQGSPYDGANPVAGLTYVNGAFYGTTEAGGSDFKHCPVSRSYGTGCGAVFKLTKSGTETLLHSFNPAAGDGEYPKGTLLWNNSMLYGTAYEGGYKLHGAVFAITTSGKESLLFSFGSQSGGYSPAAGLINVKHMLYGTTLSGGSGCSPTYSGCGTVFSLTQSGKETVLYSFQGPPDGAHPWAALTLMDGKLYGTTVNGGNTSICGLGCGTAFKLLP